MADSLADSVLLADPEPIAHARRRFSTSSQKKSAQNAASSHDAAGAAADPDTCRICRGEATEEEPLFYPCKCSGSIKFVHQDCLMEWLSHSQKKHCELCKTPFRFTKLYDRRMPQTLPFAVFVSHVAKYLLNNLLVWLRAALVVSMWLVWLPYLMRSIWSLMFWISDEGFGGSAAGTGGAVANSLGLGPAGTQGHMCPPGRDVYESAARAVSPATPLVAPLSATGTLPHSAPLARANITLGNPLYAEMFKLVLAAVGLVDDTATSSPDGLSMATVAAAAASRQPAHQRSLLGDVSFFNNMTSVPWFNRNLIYVAEGQIITILVIICFILIILVRDYVVLQQPEINMRAAFAAAENQPPRAAPLGDPAAGLRAPEIDALRGPDLAGFGSDYSDSDTESMDSDRAQDGSAVQAGRRLQDNRRLAARDYVPMPIPPYRRRPVQPATDNGEESSAARTERPLAGQELPESVIGSGSRLFNSEDDVFAPAPPPKETVEPLSVSDFTRVYREAHGDTEVMARLFQERGVAARAEPWLKLKREKDARMAARAEGGNGEPSSSHEARLQPTGPAESSTQDLRATRPTSGTEQEAVSSHDSDQSSSDWTLPSDPAGEDDVPDGGNDQHTLGQPSDSKLAGTLVTTSSDGKGKEKAVERDPSQAAGPHTRPRANTDGPFRHDGVHPLANNTWAFPQAGPSSDLPELVSPGHAGDVEGEGTTTQATPEEDADRNAATHETQAREPAPTDVPAEGETPAWVNLPDFNDLAAQRAGRDQQQQPEARPPAGIMEKLADFMWRGVNPAAEDVGQRARVRALLGEPNDEFGIGEDLLDGDDQNEGDEDNDDLDPDFRDGDMDAPPPLPEQQQRDPDAVREAVAAGLDPDAIEDAEDFEGVMELLGMRGPIAGLFQNAVFCSFLVSVTVFAGIFVPYNIGRVCVWVVANPTRPLRILFSVVKLVQDCALVAAGLTSWFALRIANMLSPLLALQGVSRDYLMPVVRASYYMSLDAARRIVDTFTMEPPVISTSEIRNFSAISHEALLSVKANVAFLLCATGRAIAFVFGGDYSAKGNSVASFVGNATSAAWDGLKGVPGVLANPGSWVINLGPDEMPVAVNPELAFWDGTDRFWAVLAGYLALCVLAALYLHRGRPFSTSQAGQDREASLVDGLNQASGVMKVILIIGIEMLIFPLYCGLLLDVALLPLFENTTLRSRVLFTYNYPLTSIFVHWFVGTGYMFHFALFVSMCRKIMRKGVLYFIRDPDDPEFHPVRDVLERNVTTQLRKILFSAFVYGALVIICLGGVVWGLWASLPGVLPIHYSSNEPVLEFPIDLLFYNFLMPLAVKFFRPSDGLHAMYTWWFRRCARALRVTWFLFGERRIDEEGVLMLGPKSEARKLPFWRRLFLEVDSNADVVPKKWGDLFEMGKTKTTAEMKQDELATLALRKALLVHSRQIVPDGRFVRTPASDQVKVPKGSRVFLEVTEANVRVDGLPDRADADLYSGDSYQLVYIPPHFRLRIFLFILSIWIFAAVTGVSFTIIPLIFGRRVFKMLIPAHIRTNDIYAFSIGIYVLGSLAYGLFHIGELWASAKKRLTDTAYAAWDHAAARRAAAIATRAAKLVYCYFFLLVVFPLLVTSLVELYCLIPLDTYMYPASFADGGAVAGGLGSGGSGRNSIIHGPPADAGSRHTIRVIQAWTIGLLYLKLSARIVNSWYEESRPAAALRAVVADGWLNPDVGVLTRAFIIPGLVLSAIAIVGPLAAAHAFLSCYQGGKSSEEAAAATAAINPTLVYRLSYPVAALGVLATSVAWATFGVFRSWRVRIRDEAYLIGERLHNFGASSSGPPPMPGGHNHPRARVAWREGAAAAI